MNQPTVYGQLQSEKTAQENAIARQIVREIGMFGINERQRWLIIHGLAMELENVEDLKTLVGFVKNLKGHEVFLTGHDKEFDDGTID